MITRNVVSFALAARGALLLRLQLLLRRLILSHLLFKILLMPQLLSLMQMVIRVQYRLEYRPCARCRLQRDRDDWDVLAAGVDRLMLLLRVVLWRHLEFCSVCWVGVPFQTNFQTLLPHIRIKVYLRYVTNLILLLWTLHACMNSLQLLVISFKLWWIALNNSLTFFNKRSFHKWRLRHLNIAHICNIDNRSGDHVIAMSVLYFGVKHWWSSELW